MITRYQRKQSSELGGVNLITEDILEWVATLPKWQQKLSYVLVEKKKVTEEELEEIYEIFKVEMSLAEGDISNYDIA